MKTKLELIEIVERMSIKKEIEDAFDPKGGGNLYIDPIDGRCLNDNRERDKWNLKFLIQLHDFSKEIPLTHTSMIRQIELQYDLVCEIIEKMKE